MTSPTDPKSIGGPDKSRSANEDTGRKFAQDLPEASLGPHQRWKSMINAGTPHWSKNDDTDRLNSPEVTANQQDLAAPLPKQFM